jgi:hypothetical protein
MLCELTEEKEDDWDDCDESNASRKLLFFFR